MAQNSNEDDYENWSNVWSALSEWLQSDYVDLDELTEFVANEFLTEVNQGLDIDDIYLAETVLNTVVPLPNGAGIAVFILPERLQPFDELLQRAFREDYEIMLNQPSDPDD